MLSERESSVDESVPCSRMGGLICEGMYQTEISLVYEYTGYVMDFHCLASCAFRILVYSFRGLLAKSSPAMCITKARRRTAHIALALRFRRQDISS